VSAAVEIVDVHKRFRLYDERNQSLKAALMRGRRARYQEFQALEGVSLDIAPGSTTAFIGHNGSGKSTLLKCLARILEPDRGTVRVHGKLSALLELGAGFHPELSGRENVYLNGSILGMTKRDIDARFDDIVGFSGLEPGFIDSPVKNYSSGMYVRLGFAVAINVEPEVLLVDEVLAVGDEAFQQKCAEKFADLRDAGITIVIVTHAMASVRAMCDQAAWLDHGKLRMEGEPGAVVDAYMAEMHEGREDSSESGTRWGSGEVRVDRVELLDADGKPATTFRTGDALTIRLHVASRERVTNPVFGVGVHTLAGLQVSAPNTREAGFVVDEVDGSAVVDLEIPRLLLLPGTYDLSSSATDHTITRVYDFHQRAGRFDVEPGSPRETFGGVVSLDGRWRRDG
jgi:ABC-type polysaccharide/polyol phosphate transport system ATPase subunit